MNEFYIGYEELLVMWHNTTWILSVSPNDALWCSWLCDRE